MIQRGSYFVTLSSPWRMAPSSCYLTLNYALFVAVAMVYLVRMVPESRRLCDSSGMERLRISRPEIKSNASWWNMHFKGRTQACLFLILLQLVRLSSNSDRSVKSSYISIIDKVLANIKRSKIRDKLLEVGFDDARQKETVGGLSGGWKMKLELARAMLYNADLLLLDEVSRILIFDLRAHSLTPIQPTNHVSCEVNRSLIAH